MAYICEGIGYISDILGYFRTTSCLLWSLLFRVFPPEPGAGSVLHWCKSMSKATGPPKLQTFLKCFPMYNFTITLKTIYVLTKCYQVIII